MSNAAKTTLVYYHLINRCLRKKEKKKVNNSNWVFQMFFKRAILIAGVSRAKTII